MKEKGGEKRNGKKGRVTAEKREGWGGGKIGRGKGREVDRQGKRYVGKRKIRDGEGLEGQGREVEREGKRKVGEIEKGNKGKGKVKVEN